MGEIDLVWINIFSELRFPFKGFTGLQFVSCETFAKQEKIMTESAEMYFV